MTPLLPLPGRAAVELTLGDDTPLGEFAVESASIVDEVNAPRRWVVSMIATSRDVYEQTLVNTLLSAERQVRIRWGVIGGGGTSTWTPWETCRVLEVRARLQSNLTAQGYPFDLILANRLFEFGLEPQVAARTGLVSAIVGDLAEEHEVQSVIEQTGGEHIALIQSYCTNLQFLLQRLLPAAANGSGLGSYYTWMDADVLHFHTRDYQQPIATLPYNQLPSASDLVAIDDTVVNAQNGGGGVTLVAYDPMAGRTHILNSQAGRYRRFGTRLAQSEGSDRFGGHIGPNQVAWEQNQVQAQYATSRDRYQRIVFFAPNLPALRAGTLFFLQTPEPTDSSNGVYFVEKANVTITGGAASAAIIAVRGEVNGGRQDAGVESAALPPQFDAPGMDLAAAPQTGTGEGQLVEDAD